MSREQSGGLSVTTLLIASGSAAAAAVIVPLFWDRGSLVAAAITPVIVTLTSEALKKPVEKVQTRRGLAQDAPGHRGAPARRPRLRGPRPRGGAARGRPGADGRPVRPARARARRLLHAPARGARARHRPAGLRDRRRRRHGVRAGDLRRLRLARSTARPSSAASPGSADADADRDPDGHAGGRGRHADADADAERDAVGDPDAVGDARRRRPSVAPNAATPEPGRHAGAAPRSLGAWPRTGSRPRASPARRG